MVAFVDVPDMRASVTDPWNGVPFAVVPVVGAFRVSTAGPGFVRATVIVA